MTSVMPCFWFDGGVQEAIDLYTSLFPDSRVTAISTYPEGSGQSGEILTATMELAGLPVMLLNGGPHYSLTPAASLCVTCDDQGEVDRLWEALLAGGVPSQCGWLTDRFGLSWQIVPRLLSELMSDPDAQRVARVTEAMLGMVKLESAELQAAFDGHA